MSDSCLTSRIIEAYADLDRLTEEECRSIAHDESIDDNIDYSQCLLVKDALGITGTIDDGESAYLLKSYLPSELVDSLSGTKALEARVRWLGEKVRTRGPFAEAKPRYGALHEIERLGPLAEGAAVYLVDLLQAEYGNHPPELVRDAAITLKRLGEVAVPAIMDAFLRSDRSPMEQKFMKILYAIGKPAVPALVEALKEDERSDVRCDILITLEWIGEGSKAAEDVLIDILKEDGDWTSRSRAARILGKIKSKKAIPALKRTAKKDKMEDVRIVAAESLELIKGK